jgi:hypothetical protein
MSRVASITNVGNPSLAFRNPRHHDPAINGFQILVRVWSGVHIRLKKVIGNLGCGNTRTAARYDFGVHFCGGIVARHSESARIV